jgi:hypothetical protein
MFSSVDIHSFYKNKQTNQQTLKIAEGATASATPVAPTEAATSQFGAASTQLGAAPPPMQTTANDGPKVIYVPRNVYVPVIKPVFVPRERT